MRMCCIAICAYIQPYCIYCISGIFFIFSIYFLCIALVHIYCLYIAYSSYFAYFWSIYVYTSIKCIFSMYYIRCIYMYILPILLLCPAAGPAQEQEKCGRGGAGGGGSGCGACRAAARSGGPVERSGRRSGVAIPGRIRKRLRATKSAHEPVIVELAGMVQEQPATGLAGMEQAEICVNMQRICSYV